jgi:hypothetical protein
MKDKLEQYILDHRQELDLYEPDPELWNKIKFRRAQTISMPTNWKRVLMRAAIFIAIFMSGFFLNSYLRNNNTKIVSKNVRDIVVPELREAEIYYTAIVDKKLKEIHLHSVGYPDIERDLHKEINQLDSIYADLKRDLKDNINNEEVIDAMIKNYQLKIQILEDILNQIKSRENKNDNNEKKSFSL